MKNTSLKLALILGLGIASINFTACNTTVKETTNDVGNAIDSVHAPDVDITPDTKLENDVEAAVAGFPGVRADVDDGVVVLKGEIAKDRLEALMKAVNDLKPKKVENQLEVK